jgi:uncharacterized coiled-coil DUF342 family protein
MSVSAVNREKSAILAKIAEQEAELADVARVFRTSSNSMNLDYAYSRECWAKDKIKEFKRKLADLELTRDEIHEQIGTLQVEFFDCGREIRLNKSANARSRATMRLTSVRERIFELGELLCLVQQ